jgi:RNA polymerase sigma factor (sigma-70 family)
MPQASGAVDFSDFIERNGNELLATARRNSSVAADADDAYQRSLIILLTKAPELPENELMAWMHTVVRNEALQMTRSHVKLVDAEFEEISASWVSDVGDPESRLVDRETYAFDREALGEIRPDQARCLLLRADGRDYPEICEVTGFSYAKVNRLLSEGRKAMRTHVGMIESGAECLRFEPILSAMADGVASEFDKKAADRHLENCQNCRATLRDYTMTARDLAAILPVGVAATHVHGIARAGNWFQSLYESVQARIAGNGQGVQNGAEVAMAKKAIAVVAITVSVAGGGLAIKHATSDSGPAAKPNSAAPRALSPAALTNASAKRAHDARVKRARERRANAAADRAVPVADTARRVQSDPATPAADALGDGTAGDTQAAADPADQAPANAPATDGQAGGLAP